MPSRTSACKTGSRWRDGSLWRAASALAVTGRLRALIATSITAAMARMPLRDISGMNAPVATNFNGNRLQSNIRLASSRKHRTTLSTSGRAEPTRSTFGFIERFDFVQLRARHGCNHQLGDSHAACNRHRFAAEVHQEHLYLAAVIGIDGAGRVEHGEPVPHGEAGARPH